MNVAELRTLTSLILNYTPTLANQDYQAADILTAINQAYNEQVILLAENSLLEQMHSTYEFTWAASDVSMEVPSVLQGKLLLRLANVTNNDLGDKLIFSSFGSDSDIFWKDYKTLQWGTTGPSSATTVRATFQATAETLITESDIPKLIPPQFHPLIAWAAACWLKEVAEEASPAIWQGRVVSMQERLWKFMSRGKPFSEPPAIKRWRPTDGGSDGF